MTLPTGQHHQHAGVGVAVGLILAYGLLRLANSRVHRAARLVFAKATHGAARSIALQTFEHLHAPEPALSPGAPDRRHDAQTSSAACAASSR